MDTPAPAHDLPTIAHSSRRPEATPPLSLEQARLVNALCEQFEADLRSDRAPRIEEFLGRVDDSTRAALLRELLALEVEVLRDRGTNPERSGYLERFPAPPDAAVVRSLLGDEAALPVPSPGVEVFGEYELLSTLGLGGMGVVHRARLITANRLVALKRMRFGPTATADEARRFRLEAEAAANLEHPNIVPIYEVGRVRGQPYFTMKLLEGGSLDRVVDRFANDPREAARLVAKIAQAVHFAHRCGFLHRDLKPANILLDAAGEPHVTDFGLAKRVADAPDAAGRRDATGTGVILGTPSFMAPEQASADPSGVTATADVYSLGAILYCLLTGRPPFLAPTVMETLLQVNEKEPVPPREIRPSIPLDLERICLKCLDKSPERRYPTAQALAEDLDRYLRGEEVEARRIGLLGRGRRWFRREPELAFRLVGVGAITLLTQVNYYLIEPSKRDLLVHGQTIRVELIWLAMAIVLRGISRRSGWTERVRPGWVLMDVGFLSGLLWLLDDVDTTLVVGYPLLIAAAGLWSSARLVGLATAASFAAFLALWMDARARGGVDKPHHLDVVLTVLVVTGLIIAHQVRRAHRMSRYYEQQAQRR